MSWTRKEPWQNKANFEQPSRNPEAQLRKTKPIPAGPEYNEGRTCETNPISYALGRVARGASEEVGRGRPTYQAPNCAKRTQFRRPGPHCDGAADSLFLSPMVASILGGHRQPKNRNGKG